jgi:hypothetical protein
MSIRLCVYTPREEISREHWRHIDRMSDAPIADFATVCRPTLHFLRGWRLHHTYLYNNFNAISVDLAAYHDLNEK